MILNELVSDRVTIKETHFVYNKPKLIKSIGNKYTRKALNMLSKNMIVNRVVTGAKFICNFPRYIVKFIEICRNIFFRDNSFNHFFHKNSSKSIVLTLNMLSKNMIVNRVVTGAGNRVICIKEGKKKKVSEKIRFNKRISNMLFINLGLLYTKCVSLMVTLSDTNSFNIINA
jgi:hypothetical protein